jgi:small-conductance mechanosensitive channel
MEPQFERQKLQTMEREINELTGSVSQLKETVNGVKDKLNNLISALLGNDITQDGGLVRRVINTEITIKAQDSKMDKLEKKLDTANIYVRIMWVCVGAVGSAILYVAGEVLLKTKP